MKPIYLYSVVLACVFTYMGCSTSTLKLPDIAGTPKQFEPRQIIVTLSEDVRNQWQSINKEILDRYDVQPAGEFPLQSIHVNCLVYRVSEMVEVDEIIRRLRADNRIQLVQINQVFDGVQGHQVNPYSEMSYGPKMIHSDLAHTIATGKGISIAIIDTGVDTEHIELKGRVATSRNFVDGGNDSFAKDKHGTGVAGVIAAQNNNDIGIDGIAPDATIDVYKACWYANANSDKASCSSWTLAKAIDAAVTNGSRIINLSLAGPEDPLLKQLLTTAEQHHIVLVAAALENKGEPGFPASLDFVLPVVSADPRGKPSHPSWRINQGVIAAPGVEILTTAPGDRYDFLSGSSLAAAHVTGIIALMLQYQPQLQPEAVRSVLKQPTHSISYLQVNDSQSNILVVDACHALDALGATINCP